ncbi:MAG: hypothetical protein FWH00_02415, partial [Oscillospiraceae bacterium]|nr:hypothetical protein [Oscillospiraceae bacterium]
RGGAPPPPAPPGARAPPPPRGGGGGTCNVPERAVSIREATFAALREIPVENAAGEIAAGMVTACPPGIPVLIPGERIDNNITTLLKNSGVLSVNVVE